MPSFHTFGIHIYVTISEFELLYEKKVFVKLSHSLPYAEIESMLEEEENNNIHTELLRL